jgi:osmotically-inducible protein OsmY
MRVTRDTFDAGARDMANRGAGAVDRTRSIFRRRQTDDEVLIERVRAKMGRYVSHPGAIEVQATEGTVTLTGSILHHEHEELLQAVRDVPGVKDVVDQLVVYNSAEGISELQGGRPRRGEVPELVQDNGRRVPAS